MRLTVLSVSYPFVPVTADPVGGSEQILAHLDRALVAAGHRSLVIAPRGSRVRGELIDLPHCPGMLDVVARAQRHDLVRARIAEVMRRERVDLLHLHGLDYHCYLPPAGPPVLVMLHLPLHWYPEVALRPERPDVWLVPVSRDQAARSSRGLRLTPPIENGVAVPDLALYKRNFALSFGRICPEKGFDDALDAARQALAPLLLAGMVFPYPDHQAFFRDRIRPRLDGLRRWIGRIGGRRKTRLLSEARAVLVPSKVPETSCLVAMEALAAGTPVVAYGAGALADLVEEGRTGFLVRNIAEMAAALARVGEIDPAECHRRARERFSLERMTDAYLARYAALAAA